MDNPPNTSGCGLLVSGVTIAYDHMVLNNYSAFFENGGLYSLMGPSGSGKTTLLRLLAGLEKADSGRICWMNSTERTLQTESGYIYSPGTIKFSICFQEDRLLENRDAVDNIRFVVPDYAPEEIVQLLEELGIDAQECRKPVAGFSGGMKRRTALLRALLYHSDVLLLDEPFKGLDEENRAKAIRLLLRVRKNRTVILTSHEEADAEACHAVIVRIP